MVYIDPSVACTSWVTPDQLCCEGSGSVTDCDGTVTPLAYEWTDAILCQMASNILFARTCYRYPGECARSVWPCLDACGCGSSHPCRCGAYYAINLTSDYPILSVEDVTIDGVAFAAWRLDENARVVRTDGNPWPNCNDLGLTNPPSTGQTVQVDYTTGRIPPPELQMAAAELACELKKACNGDASCALPAHVKRVVRRDVEIEPFDVTQLLLNGVTGNPLIDHALTVYGRCKRGRMFDATKLHRSVRIS